MTSYDAAVYRETLRQENSAKANWIKQHGSDNKVFEPDSAQARATSCRPVLNAAGTRVASRFLQAVKLRSLKDHVADLCDLQPTCVSRTRRI